MSHVVEDGIVLRPPVPDDRVRWLELQHDPMQVAYGTPYFLKQPTDVSGLDELVEKARVAYQECAPGVFVVASPDDDRFLGMVSWRREHPPEMKLADIGYGVHPDARGRGIARAAVRRFTTWLVDPREGPGLERVQLDHSVENPASCQVALAAGFAREGVRRGFLPLPDPADPRGYRRHDVCMHGYLPGDTIPAS